MTVKLSLRQRINEKCRICIYDELNKGTWKQQVESCTDKHCPLYEVRPRSRSAVWREKNELS